MPSDVEATRRWLNDIRHNIALAESFVEAITYEAFIKDDLRVYAVVRCLEIVSEASRRLPDELKSRHTSIAWRQMASAGNVFRHEYESVAAQRVWRTLTVDLAELRRVVAVELERLQ
jgi:uncharacterized protein with HEPN domain